MSLKLYSPNQTGSLIAKIMVAAGLGQVKVELVLITEEQRKSPEFLAK